ncbi:ankyrin [Penicillium angulare]|uniref:ankyrin n=1 Tax=Penicillium angulare TaxID=116970 RepID=UPI00253F6E33|nr:ankyrin [Penicillium angulare]KAJ5279502.1 ankyrin [Penicillium angulare]
MAKDFNQPAPERLLIIPKESQRHPISWQPLRDFEHRAQHYSARGLSQKLDLASQVLFVACLLNGYGIPTNDGKVLELLLKVAVDGFFILQAYAYRIFRACSRHIPFDVPVLSFLTRQSLQGSRMVLEDLHELDSVKATKLRETVRSKTGGGVGAGWFLNDQWLGEELDIELICRGKFSTMSLGSKSKLADAVLNVRGDNIIHLAAATVHPNLFMALVTRFHLDVNKTNKEGETALLCACRSDHPNVVLFLLGNGAKATIQASNEESPLHWLISFGERIDTKALRRDLIERSEANVNVFTTRRMIREQKTG